MTEENSCQVLQVFEPRKSLYNNEDKLNILDFPMEMIIKIFIYLNPSDLNSVALTCQRFLEATKYYQFMYQRSLLLHKINFCEDLLPISDLLNSCRCFAHITLYVVRFSDNNYFWMVFGGFVRSLTLKMCIVKKDRFLAILRYLPNLEELSLYDCNELVARWPREDADCYKPRLFKLKKLNLQKISVLPAHVFDYIFDMAPNLTCISLVDCFKECTDSVLRVKMIDHCILAMYRKRKQLTSVDLLGTPLDDLALVKLAANGLTLSNFSLSFTGRISNPGILDFFKMQDTLTTLDLSDSLNLLDHCLFLICSKMSSLRVLKLRRCVMISDFGIKEVVHLKKLLCLDISGCERISDNGFHDGVVCKSWENWKERLEDLSIGSNNSLTEITLQMTTSMFLHLTKLDVSSSTNCLTDYTMQLINRYLTKLRYFYLDYCGQVSDAGITGIDFNDDRNTALHKYPITNLKGLRVLRLSGVYQVSDISLNTFKFRELKELTLARCQLITDEGIINMAKHCPSLETLDLTECQNVNDYCMEFLTNYLKRLKLLKVICCNQLTDFTIESIIENCQVLKTLYIRGCYQISYESLQKLNTLTCLRYVHSN